MLVDFYKGLIPDSHGRTFDDLLSYSDDAMERSHNHIQWMFPLPEKSRAQPSSPVLSKEDLEIFKTDPEIKKNMRLALDRFILFMDGTNNWKRFYDHNHLRITRIIRILTLMGLSVEAKGMYNKACDDSNANIRAQWYWKEALDSQPAWL